MKHEFHQFYKIVFVMKRFILTLNLTIVYLTLPIYTKLVIPCLFATQFTYVSFYFFVAKFILVYIYIYILHYWNGTIVACLYILGTLNQRSWKGNSNVCNVFYVTVLSPSNSHWSIIIVSKYQLLLLLFYLTTVCILYYEVDYTTLE